MPSARARTPRVPLALLALLALPPACAPAASTMDASALDGALDPGDASMLDATSPDAPEPPREAGPDGRYTFPDALPAVGDPLALDPRARGPFRAGYRSLEHTYTPAGTRTPRTITVHVWYPTFALSGPNPTYARLFRDTESFRDAPPAPPAHAAGYPVHVYSHGDRGFGGTSHFLMRYFATHGWVSVAPDHLGNTLLEPARDPRPYALYHLRSRDVSAALDAVAALPASDPLGGRLRTQRAVLTGHSFGAHTVWASAGATFDLAQLRTRCTPAVGCTDEDLAVFATSLRDERFVAVVPMAGTLKRDLFGPMGHASVRVPMLAMSGSADPVGQQEQFDSTAPLPMHWIDVREACHQFFALGPCPNVPDEEQERIVGAWALAFARRHVLDDTGSAVRSLLDGSNPVSDRVTLRQR